MRFKCFIILILTTFVLNAQNSKIINLQVERKKNEAEIAEIKVLTKQISKTKDNLLYLLHLSTEKINLIKKNISSLNSEIDIIDKEIEDAEKYIVILEDELNYKKENYAQSLRQMHLKRNTQDKLLYVLAGEDFAQSFRRIRHMKEYSEWQKQQGIEIKLKQEQLKERKQMLEASKKDKFARVQEREKEGDNLKKEESDQKKEVNSLTAKEKELKKELDKKTKQAQELNRQIQKAIAEEVARANAEAERLRKANAEAEKANKANEIREIPKANTAGGYAMTKEERQLSSDFESNRGRLPFPLKGSYKIVSQFGQQKFSPEVTLLSNGIDIQTLTPNNDARSVFGGEVTKVFAVPGYNNSVIVRHGNYLTVYCNLSEVYVKAKDKVKTGQALGRIYTDSQAGNATILHFELWKETTKQNPMGWLNK